MDRTANPLADLERRSLAALPGVSIKRARMAAPGRVDALDVYRGDRVIAVLWTAVDGFCIADITDDGVLDDSPDFVVASVDDALEILTSMLDAADSRTPGRPGRELPTLRSDDVGDVR